MKTGVFALVDAVCSIWVRHHREKLVVFDELVDHHLKALVVDIVVTGSVHDEQVTLQVFCMRYRRTFAIVFCIVLEQAHIAFLVCRVIQLLVRDE